MGLAEAEQWWERWQLRVLVLGSLSLQFFLLVAAALRRRRTPPWFRLLTWAAYLGSDALAIYALATLFTRHKKQQPAGGGSSSSSSPSPHGGAELEALWAPVLLLHLGGQDGFTAYSIQDNELWQRHLFTAASQVAIAVYVFRKSWPQGGDVRVLAAAILLFFPGILKCLHKPWALSKSSIRSTAAAVGAEVSKEKEKEQDTSTKAPTNPCNNIKEFVDEASRMYSGNNYQAGLLEVIHHLFLFVDLPHYPYSVRLNLLSHVCPHKKKAQEAHLLVRSGLSRAFDHFYTAAGYKGYLVALAVRVTLLVLLLVLSMALVIVTTTSRRSREAYANTATADDLRVTFVLLSCTAGLEVASAVTMAWFQRMDNPPWPEEVAQCNLIGYLVYNEAWRHRCVRRLASLLGCQAYLDWLWCTASSRTTTRPSSSSLSDDGGITSLIYTHIADQWKKPDGATSMDKEYYIKDLDTYRRFSDSRGQWTIDKEASSSRLALAASSSLERPFDESVMVWHLATDMCFFHSVGNEQMESVKRQCRAISNYMAYLLLVNPEMLMPGARRRIFTVAYFQVREVIVEGESTEDEDDVLTEKNKVPLPPGDNEDMARKLIQNLRKPKTTKDTPPSRSPSLVHDAWALAKELMEMEEGKTWSVICGVWVEMLCFSASRCRGYLHAKSLATGGEYLSYVWFLRAYMGMEILAQRMQVTEEGDLVTGADNV